MGKLTNMVLLVFAVQIALILFIGSSAPGGALWSLITNPSDWSSLTLMDFLTDTLLVIGLGTIIAGGIASITGGQPDFIVFAGITTVFLSFGSSLYNLWQYINSKVVLGGTMSGYAWTAIFFISPLIILYIMVILEFWRGRD